MTDVDTANDILAGLAAKLADAKQRQADADASAAQVSFSAHIGDEPAQKVLEGLNREIAKSSREVVSLEAACAEARRRVGAAAGVAAAEAERERAQQALALLADFSQRGEALDKIFDKALAEYGELMRDFKQLNAIGYAPSSPAAVGVHMRLAVASKLQFTDLRQEFLPPYQRKRFVEVIEGWSNSIRLKATARLTRNAPDKAA